MVLKYFFHEKDFTFEELDKISDKQKDKWSWSCAALVELKRMGLKVRHYSTFDYSAFVKNGADYIRKIYEKDVAEKMIEMSDINSEIENANDMLRENIFELRELSFEDVEKHFKEGYAITLLINSRIINNEDGYSGHFVVLTGFDEINVFINDPAIKHGSENRKLNKNLFIRAWAFPKKENDIILIKR
jgi:hypothetical protein